MIDVLESNLEMKEENQILKEQDVIRNELLQRYEKKIETLESEVSIETSNENQRVLLESFTCSLVDLLQRSE